MRKATERQLAFAFGTVFVVVLILLAVLFPHPSPFQYMVFRVVLALATAGVAVNFPGFLEVRVPNWIKAGGALAVFVVVFFYNPAALVADPEPAPLGDFEVYSLDRKLDLARWQFVPELNKEDRLSAAFWSDTYKVRRLRPTARQFTVRHASSGAPAPEFASPTHHLTVEETKERPQGGPRPKLRIFDITVDVSGEPIGEWFDLVINATYWNAFNNAEDGWAGLPIVHPTQQAVFEISFPTTKPVSSWERRRGSRDTATSDLVTDNAITVEEDGSRLRWKIEAPELNWVYKIIWEW